jgi:hypothetical protein
MNYKKNHLNKFDKNNGILDRSHIIQSSLKNKNIIYFLDRIHGIKESHM